MATIEYGPVLTGHVVWHMLISLLHRKTSRKEAEPIFHGCESVRQAMLPRLIKGIDYLQQVKLQEEWMDGINTRALKGSDNCMVFISVSFNGEPIQ